MEDLRAAARQAAQASFLELSQQVARRPAGQLGEPVPLDGRVRLQVQPGVVAVDDADHIEVPLVGQLMMQAANDVQLRGAAALGLGGTLEDLLIAHDVALLALQVGPEGAEGAAVDTDIGRVEVGVDVVVGEVAVLALADEIGQFTKREQVRGIVEVNTLFER